MTLALTTYHKKGMKYLLDTNICIYIMKNRPPQVISKFKKFDIGDVAISSITLFELQYGAYKSQNMDKSLEVIQSFIAPLDIIPFGRKAADICGKIRADLQLQGNVIGLADIQIAAIAMGRDYTLVTNNLKEFQRINGLVLENWV